MDLGQQALDSESLLIPKGMMMETEPQLKYCINRIPQRRAIKRYIGTQVQITKPQPDIIVFIFYRFEKSDYVRYP